MTLTTTFSKDEAATELSSRRTGMSFQRTRMSADRTLMSVMRTSLSLISFGFTIFQFFKHLEETKVLTSARPSARNFGLTLLTLGAGMLAFGIIYHLLFMRELRRERNQLVAEGLVHGESAFPASLSVIIALLLLLVGLLAVTSIAFKFGPFQ
jgi:putative membrane protein